MIPKIWGPKAWFLIHALALNYPKNPNFKEKQEYSNFFKSLKYVLPCLACAKHYEENIKKYPIDNYLDTTESLFNWTVDLHNMVNYQTGKFFRQVFVSFPCLFSSPLRCVVCDSSVHRSKSL